MGSIVQTLRIRTLRKLIDASRKQSETLARQFEAAQTSTEKTKIAREYDQALKQTHAMQFLLEKEERKAKDRDLRTRDAGRQGRRAERKAKS
ncbi:MAG: hypothetical protein WBA18_06215 [Terracidiphilus sp.]